MCCKISLFIFSNWLYCSKKIKALSKLPNAVWIEPIGAERRTIRLEPCCSGRFQSAPMLRNRLRAVGSVHIPSFQIFKNVLYIVIYLEYLKKYVSSQRLSITCCASVQRIKIRGYKMIRAVRLLYRALAGLNALSRRH